ncbi:MAG: hypothetical protein IPN01_13230 [Deltaproteobacteria bacterium]|nr:hypothetical protein [Deltaproteobacteria bacterium]
MAQRSARSQEQRRSLAQAASRLKVLFATRPEVINLFNTLMLVPLTEWEVKSTAAEAARAVVQQSTAESSARMKAMAAALRALVLRLKADHAPDGEPELRRLMGDRTASDVLALSSSARVEVLLDLDKRLDATPPVWEPEAVPLRMTTRDAEKGLGDLASARRARKVASAAEDAADRALSAAWVVLAAALGKVLTPQELAEAVPEFSSPKKSATTDEGAGA